MESTDTGGNSIGKLDEQGKEFNFVEWLNENIEGFDKIVDFKQLGQKLREDMSGDLSERHYRDKIRNCGPEISRSKLAMDEKIRILSETRATVSLKFIKIAHQTGEIDIGKKKEGEFCVMIKQKIGELKTHDEMIVEEKPHDEEKVEHEKVDEQLDTIVKLKKELIQALRTVQLLSSANLLLQERVKELENQVCSNVKTSKVTHPEVRKAPDIQKNNGTTVFDRLYTGARTTKLAPPPPKEQRLDAKKAMQPRMRF